MNGSHETGLVGRGRRALTRGVAIMLVAAASLAPLASTAAAAGTPRRVLALKSGALALYDEVLEGFRVQAGFRPEERILPEEDEDQATFLDGIRAIDPDLIVTLGTKASEWAQQHFESTPMIYAMVLDPRELRGPGVRGVPQTVPLALQLRELKALVPGIRTVGVPFNPANSSAAVKEAEDAAAALGLRVEPIRVESRSEAVDRVSRYLEDVQALWLPLDSTLINRQALPAIASLARRSKVALMVHSAEIVRDGVLLALEVSTADAGRSIGDMVRAFLAGEPFTRLALPELKPRIHIDHDVARELGIPDERVRAAEDRFR